MFSSVMTLKLLSKSIPTLLSEIFSSNIIFNVLFSNFSLFSSNSIRLIFSGKYCIFNVKFLFEEIILFPIYISLSINEKYFWIFSVVIFTNSGSSSTVSLVKLLFRLSLIMLFSPLFRTVMSPWIFSLLVKLLYLMVLFEPVTFIVLS